MVIAGHGLIFEPPIGPRRRRQVRRPDRESPRASVRAETLMDAQLASGVSDEISPTRRESPVQLKQKLVIAFVRRTNGLQIPTSDGAFPDDHLFRPFRDGAPIPRAQTLPAWKLV